MKLTNPTEFLQANNTRLAVSLVRSIMIFLAFIAVVAFIVPANDDLVTALFYGPALLLLAVVHVAAKRGNIMVAGHALAGILYGGSVAAVVVLGGIQANATSAFIVCIMVAAALLGTRWAFAWTALSVVTVVTLAGLELYGLLPDAVAPRTLANSVLGTVFPIVFSVWIMYRMLEIRHLALVAAAERERERDQAQADLIQAQKMDVVGRLTSGIAHDFNNLLTVIQSSVELLKLEGTADPLLDDIEDSSRRAGMLTSRLLAFARPRDFDPRPTDLNESLEDFGPLLRTIVGDEIRLEIDSEKSTVAVVDPLGFQQILLNLVINAREALDGRGRIVITVSRGPEFATLSVSDNGPGVPAHVQSQIFNPFFTTKDAGTGLGLATVTRLVENSAGTIELKSGSDGATFVIRWPSISEDLLHRADVPSPSQALPAGVHILVVDDNDNVRRSMAGLLESYEFEITEASDGLEALSVLERTRPDLVITDNSMPGMTGVELAERIRASYPNLPILIVSGNLLDGVPVQQCRFLSKPFGGAALTSTISELLQPTQGTGP